MEWDRGTLVKVRGSLSLPNEAMNVERQSLCLEIAEKSEGRWVVAGSDGCSPDRRQSVVSKGWRKEGNVFGRLDLPPSDSPVVFPAVEVHERRRRND